MALHSWLPCLSVVLVSRGMFRAPSAKQGILGAQATTSGLPRGLVEVDSPPGWEPLCPHPRPGSFTSLFHSQAQKGRGLENPGAPADGVEGGSGIDMQVHVLEKGVEQWQLPPLVQTPPAVLAAGPGRTPPRAWRGHQASSSQCV